MSGSEETQGQEERKQGSRRRQPTSQWEWVAAGISTLLVLGAVGFMGYEALVGPSGPPRLRIEVDSIMAAQGGYLVEFRVHNSGPATAAALLVKGELHADTGTVETSEVTIQFVPGEAARRAGLYFSHDPRLYRLEIRPKGYDRP